MGHKPADHRMTEQEEGDCSVRILLTRGAGEEIVLNSSVAIGDKNARCWDQGRRNQRCDKLVNFGGQPARSLGGE
jgi:hypothetical protein